MKKKCVTLVLLFVLSLSGSAFGLEIIADINGFTPEEQAVIEAAIAWWEMSIKDDIVMNITINKAPLCGTTLGETRGFMADGGGTPTGAHIDIDDDAAGTGWFVDETPHEDEEFKMQGSSGGAVSGSGAEDLTDLLTVVKHEIGHAVGFTVAYVNFGGQVTDPGGGDPRTYTGEECIWTLVPAGGGTHFCPDEHPDDLMNPVVPTGRRRVQSCDDLKILADAFDLSINKPDVNIVPPIEVAFSMVDRDSHLSATANKLGWRPGDLTVKRRIVLSETPGFSTVKSDWLGLFLTDDEIYWMRFTRRAGRSEPEIEGGHSAASVAEFEKLWQALQDLDAMSLKSERSDDWVEDASTFVFQLEDNSGAHAFSAKDLMGMDDLRYLDAYDLITEFYALVSGR